MIKAERNIFDGYSIKPEDLPDDPDQFSVMLTESLDYWREEEGQLIWLEIPIQKSALIPVAVQAGFRFHHTEDDSLTLTYSLNPGAFIPQFATHYIGAGGVVLNEAQDLLVISEKAHRHHRPHYYKLPGGALQPREHLVDGVIREVYEETGIKTSFLSLMCFRHWHGYRYGKSDIYFICRLRPLTYEISIQDAEIEECLWMPVEHYLELDSVGIFNKRIVAYSLENGGLAPTWIEGYGDDRSMREIFIPWQVEHDANSR